MQTLYLVVDFDAPRLLANNFSLQPLLRGIEHLNAVPETQDPARLRCGRVRAAQQGDGRIVDFSANHSHMRGQQTKIVTW